MRVLAVLTACLAPLVFLAGAGAGQTRESLQERTTLAELVIQYNQLEQQHKRWLAVIGKSCKSAEKAIVYYRNKVWAYQKDLHEARKPTRYPERKLNACAYKKWAAGNWKAIAGEYRKLVHKVNSDPKAAICHVFGTYCQQALKVVHCETGGTYSVWAQNGQYLGLFQMGNYARGRYGHSTNALGQARAAYAYFVDTGKTWRPWQCRPWGLAW